MTIFGITVTMTMFWLAIAIILLIIEAVTMGLTTIWFAGGALLALVTSLFSDSIILQGAVFTVVSVILLVFTRKLFVKKLHTGEEKTNVDALPGQYAVVIRDIKPFVPGLIKLNGQEWTAVCYDPQKEILLDARVKVISIEGVKAVVAPAES